MEDVVLLERVQAAAARAFVRHPVLAAYAFGSRVSGRPRPSSDLDVGYYVDAGSSLDPRDEMAIAAELEDAAGIAIDLRDLSDAPLDLRGRVLEAGVRIYSGDAARRVALERFVLSRYHDYKDEYRRMHDMRLRRVAARGF